MSEQGDRAEAPSTPSPRAQTSAGPSRRRRTWQRRFGQAVIAALIDMVARFIWATGRIRVSIDETSQHVLADSRRPVLFCCWHGRMGMGIWYVRALARAGRRVAVLISPSVDGDLVARVAEGWGLLVVRGSSTRTGVRGLRALHHAVTDGVSTMLLVDGPKGPAGRCKPGPVMLARLSGAPIIPIGWASIREWHARSWDAYAIPWPFSRMRIRVGPPITLERRADVGRRDAVVAEVERALEALAADARRAIT